MFAARHRLRETPNLQIDGRWRIPALQFGRKKLVPNIGEVNAVIDRELDAVSVLWWSTTPDPELETSDDEVLRPPDVVLLDKRRDACMPLLERERQHPSTPDEQSDAGRVAEPVPRGDSLFEQYEQCEARNPVEVHHAAEKHQPDQEPTAADADSAVQKTHA